MAFVDQVRDDALDLVQPEVLLAPFEPKLDPLQLELVRRLDPLYPFEEVAVHESLELLEHQVRP
eukprot:CAMPEP_0205922532 /NCGR_PEP_ID=MMETSP1325-20131115/14643_1 /ASSEMBLY_ACC=CAM_ASM_000708 /TAXON_ID=236786 /ORGANISM="Florenciella sp., Strain RCC1007" /LENGTH=63 /DNA_ID=CAMNT_0053290559 /DNA_START=87 /DNA_END=275 /DNA_ORIENTATION=-